MGGSAVLEQASDANAALENDECADFLGELRLAVPGLRDGLELLSEDDLGGQLQIFANEIKAFAVLAGRRQHPLLAQELSGCEAILRGAVVLGSVSPSELDELGQSLARVEAYLETMEEIEHTPTSGPLPAVQSALPRLEPSDEPSEPAAPLPAELSVLVVGSEAVVRLLQTPGSKASASAQDAPALEIERAPRPEEAMDLARALAPDLVVLDADASGAEGLLESLQQSSDTASIPVVAIGSWDRPEEVGRLLERGVARSLPKPVSPRDLRQSCLEVVSAQSQHSFTPLGETTLEDLGTRLGEELRSGLCDAADEQTRETHVDLGQGGEILGVLWGAMGRIRELVTARSKGRVQFVPVGPAGALPAASWSLGGEPGTRSRWGSALDEVGRAGQESALDGRRIVVADDDLSVNWFLTGVLREAGATAYDAADGGQALRLAYRHAPDLIISDVIMPGLDGFALCRAVKRDVVLRGVPVILLSWKDDLLQRVRELGAGADAYLRKGASGPAVVERVAEVLHSRQQLAQGIAAGGTVRDGLEGLTGYALLRLCCEHRPESRLTVRDAMFVYEVEIRGGRPVSAQRATADGKAEWGERALGALLGVTSGRFGLVDSTEPVDEELFGSLDEQILEPVATARAALGMLSGSRLARVERVLIDESAIAAYLDATPEPAKGLLRAVMAGACPRELLSRGKTSPHLLEDVLADAARHGAVVGVVGSRGANELRAAIKREMAVLTGEDDDEAGAEPALFGEAELGAVPSSSASEEGAAVRPSWLDAPPSDVVDPREAEQSGEPGVVFELEADSADDGEPQPEPPEGEHLPTQPSVPPSTGEPSAPAQRSTRHTPILASAVKAVPSAQHHTPPFTSTAVAKSDVKLAELEPSAPEPSTIVASSANASGAPFVPPEPPAAAVVTAEPETRQAPAPEAARQPSPLPPRVPMPSAYLPRPASEEPSPRRRSRSRWALPLAFGVLGISLAVGARWLRDERRGGEPAAPPHALPPAAVVPAVPPTAVAPPAAQVPNALPAPAPSAEPARDAELPAEFPLTEDDQVGKGEGLLEIVAGRNDQIYVNGQLVGKGPMVKMALKAVPTPYEVRVKLRGEERVRYAVVKEGKRIRLRVSPPWSR